MRFADLHLLWVLVPALGVWLTLVLVPRVLAPALRRRRNGVATRDAAVRYSSLSILDGAGSSVRLAMRRFFQALRVVTVVLLMAAMLRPQTGESRTQVTTEGIDIMLVLDTSGSMQALDLEADKDINKRRHRLTIAKEVVVDFSDGRTNDQIGLVVFGAQAFTQSPLTLDHGVLASLLERVEIGMAGDATALGDALGTAIKRLQRSEATSKVIIALTDGVNNAGSLAPLTAADIAKTFGIKIYTIAAASEGEAPFLVDTRMGPKVFYQKNSIDEQTLQQIAEVTGGAYYRAEDREALAAIYAQIDELERTEIEMERFMEYTERYPWLLWPALVLLLLEIVMLATRFRKLP